MLEGLKPDMTKEECLAAIRSIVNDSQIFGGVAPREKLAKRYFEVPLRSLNSESEPLVKQTKKLMMDRIQDKILDYAETNIYHLRVHLSHDLAGGIQNLMELRYLALLLQRLRHLIDEKYAAKSRISIFIVPTSAPEYPFKDQEGAVDTKTYQMVSTYLRLISKAYTGTVYGVVDQNGTSVVKALNFKKAPRFSNHFPLTPINQETYEKLFNNPVSKVDFELLFNLTSRRQRFRNAADEQPNVAFCDYLLEASADALKLVVAKITQERQFEIMQMVKESMFGVRPDDRAEPSLLAFALFCFTFSSTSQEVLEDSAPEALVQGLRNGCRRARDLAEGLRQIAQNTLQHSPTKSGVFTFSVQAEDGRQKVRLALCDYNSDTTFAQTFIRTLQRERDAAEETYSGSETRLKLISAYNGLISEGQNLQLRNFFMEDSGSERLKAAWINFRRADIYAHVGLLLFQGMVYRYKGAVSVANTASGLLDESSIYYRNFGNSQEKGFTFELGRMIPGAQFFIEIPNTSVPSMDAQSVLGLAQFNHIHEGYYDFAQYIPFQFQYCIFPAIGNDCTAVYCEAQEKLAAVRNWRDVWLSTAKDAKTKAEKASAGQKTIFVWDMDGQSTALPASSDACEVFWKGFVEALDILGQEDYRYIAVINLSREQTAIFCRLCQTYFAKTFPQYMQVYISQALGHSGCGDHLDDGSLIAFHLIGDTYAQAMQNAYCLSTERGTRSFDVYDLEQILAMQVAGSVQAVKGLVIPENISVCPFDAILPWRQAPAQKGDQGQKDWSLPTLFDHQIELMAEGPIDKPPHGYKITNTHMQLGSKVHIHAFYEMAFLFYSTSIANRIAFELLRELNNDQSVDLLEDRLLFYGYASYSKALLTSIVEILKIYRVICKRTSQEEGHSLHLNQDMVQTLAFAAYQHNLQSESRLPKADGKEQNTPNPAVMEKTQLYFDFPKTDSGERERVLDFFQSPVKLIQIVPISSTLTTFYKMYIRLRRGLSSIVPEEQLNMQLLANYTAFWVADQPKGIGSGTLSDIEKKYIEYDADSLTKRRVVTTKFSGLGQNRKIHFLMVAAAAWETPLRCKKCYPENPIAEVPLVNVDQTSTVPTQQLRAQKTVIDPTPSQRENNARLLQLSRCIWKGHILREKNHFNYYIDTQKFFARVRYDVADWLRGLATALPEARSNPLNIIFSPEHPTNIGFAQYVNNYYFQGNAEIVCLNEDKEFRSNFSCEHMALLQAISHVFALYHGAEGQDSKDLPVKFYFVDDTIISGSTFHKANSFLHTLLPPKIRDRFPTNLISKCFVLVDRLSDASKGNYVKDIEADFYSFVHLDISNSRIQGDSCVGCKRVQNAVHLFKRSATRLHAQHWFNEINQNAICTYDDAAGYEKTAQQNPDWTHPEWKVLLAHIAQNIIFRENDFFEPGAIYDSLLEILSRLLHIENSYTSSRTFQYQILIDEVSKEAEPWQLVFEFFYLVSRPFFSYDFKCRLQVQTMLIIFAEGLLNGIQYTQSRLDALKSSTESADNYKEFLFQNRRIQHTMEIYQKLEDNLNNWHNKLDFLDGCLFSSLAELQSTYLIRKTTFSGIYRFIQNIIDNDPDSISSFLEHCASNIHYLLDSGNDDTRSLWLEYLLTTGEEYPAAAKQTDRQAWRSLYQSVTGRPMDWCQEDCAGTREQMADRLFSWFCDEIFLQNVRTIYDGIESRETNSAPEDSYSVENCRQFRTVDGFGEDICESEKSFFTVLLKYGKESDEALDVKKKYEEILQNIQKIAKEKYQFSEVKIALLTCSEKDSTQNYEIQQLDFAASGYTIPLKESWMRYGVKSKLLAALNRHDAVDYGCPLLKYGYEISCENEDRTKDENPYILTYFDNPEDPVSPSVTVSVGTAAGREVKRIVKVFLYFSAKTSGTARQDGTSTGDTRPDPLMLRLFLRDILMYRHRLMRILENDFAGDTFVKYAHTFNERNILAHEKVNSHNTSSDDRTSLEVLALPKATARYEILDSGQVLRWLLLRNYTNGQIAKLFNRSFGKQDDDRLFDRGNSSSLLPLLYISGEKTPENNLDRPLQEFYQLGLSDDARFILLEQAVSIKYADELRSANFVCNKDGNYYNAEYMKCVLIDSVFSAMKYFSDREDFLPRLDHCLKRMHIYRYQVLNQFHDESQNEFREQYDPAKEPCVVTLTREASEKDEHERNFDYLVITNKVNYRAHGLFDWKMNNDQINAHLDSPTDFFDGQMSLLAIKEYIEGFYSGYPSETKGRAKFEYVPIIDEATGEKTGLKFVSKLPILEKRGNS